MINLKIVGSGLNELYKSLMKISLEGSWELKDVDSTLESIEAIIPIGRIKDLEELLSPTSPLNYGSIIDLTIEELGEYSPNPLWTIRRSTDRRDFVENKTKEDIVMASTENEVKIKVIKIPKEDYKNLGGFDYLGIDIDKEAYLYNKVPTARSYGWSSTNNSWMHTRDLQGLVEKALSQNEPRGTLFKFEPIKQGEFTKSMLETGMAVVTKSGDTKLVVGDRLIGENTPLGVSNWNLLGSYTEDMINPYCDEDTIVKVFKYPTGLFSWDLNSTYIKLIWSRKEKSEKDLKIDELEATIKEQLENIDKAKKQLKELRSNG